MCGIVGCAGPINVKHERVFKNLLIVDSLRGTDSTGMVSVDRQGEATVAKAIGNPFNLLESRVMATAMQGFHSVLLGHNRYATQGKVSVRNAHPFEFENVVGVHNGTLRNKYYLDKGHSFDVDSEALYHHINKHGVEDAIRGLDGAWALVWYDKKEGAMNFLRNKERTLYFTVTKDKVMFWASEAWMLDACLGREDLEWTVPELLPQDQLHTVQLYNTGELAKPEVVPLASRFQPTAFIGYQTAQPQTAKTSGGTDTGTAKGNAGGGVQQSASTGAVTIDAVKAAITEVASKEALESQIPGNKEITMTVYGSGVDRTGARYYLCRCTAYPQASIRLFQHHSDRTELLNKLISGKIHAYRVKDAFGLYHKVIHSTVRLLDTGELLSKEEAAPVTYKDHKGNQLTKEDFQDKHGSCSFCTGVVDPSIGYRFSVSGDVLCHECVSDSEIHKYVQLA